MGNFIVSIPKADLVIDHPTVTNRSVFSIDAISDLQGSFTAVQPAVDLGPGSGPTSLFAVNPKSGLKQWNLSNAAESTPDGAHLMGPIDVSIPEFSLAPIGDQPGDGPGLFNLGELDYSGVPGPIDASRFSSHLVKQGDSAWGAHVVDVDGHSGVRWYEIDAPNQQLVQWGTIADPTLDFIFPSIAVNLFGDVVIGFTATGEQKLPSAYAVVGDTVSGATTFGEPIELKAGTGVYDDGLGRAFSRWGDYSATVVDPSDPYSFWTFQEFTKAQNRWAVQITQILLPGAAPRRDEIAIGPALAFLIRDNLGADGRGDTAAGDLTVNLQSSGTVGETDLTNVTANRLERLVVKFELPDRPDASNLLQEATLRVFLEKIEGIPAGPLSVLHSVSDNVLVRVTSAYEDASYGDSQDLFQLADAVTGQYYDLDVTDLVRADYAQDGAHALSAFRLQIHAARFFEDNVSHRYLVTAAGTGRPALLLSFVPEPPTSILAVGALLGVAGLWQRGRTPGIAVMRLKKRSLRSRDVG